MINKISITNYKSILSESFPLGRVNVFIGENGCGKSNILEAIAMFCASKDFDLSVDGLFNRGIRVTKPTLTFSSFLGIRSKKTIDIVLEREGTEPFGQIEAELYSENPEDIYAKWKDKKEEELNKIILHTFNINKKNFPDIAKSIINPEIPNLSFDIPENVTDEEFNQRQKEVFLNLMPLFSDDLYGKEVKRFLIYNVNTNALRGIVNTSKKLPLGIYGEGLDVLLTNFNDKELELLNKYKFISWLKKLDFDKSEDFKKLGYKLGRSTSDLYFIDKYMRQNNNVFSAENANEGALYILFYLSLFISKKTPSFFAIDNIETALNPKLCRDLIMSIAELAKINEKQVLITTHNPAVLDGLNLNDETQKLFVVRRTDEGFTKIEQIKLKPSVKDQKLKLSEMWMRGYLGGLPIENF